MRLFGDDFAPGGEFCPRFEITDEYGLTENKEGAFSCDGMINSKSGYSYLEVGKWMGMG